jgi:hypothetical protein
MRILVSMLLSVQGMTCRAASWFHKKAVFVIQGAFAYIPLHQDVRKNICELKRILAIFAVHTDHINQNP